MDTIAKTMDIIHVAKKVHEEMLIKESRKRNEAAGTLACAEALLGGVTPAKKLKK